MIKPWILKLKFWEEIYNQKKGTAIIIAFIIMGVLIISGLYFLSFTLTEGRIARSQTKSTQTYYLAEAGINKAIWKLKYDEFATSTDGDAPWATCFVTSTAPCGNCLGWSATFSTSTNSLVPNSNITVTIQNSTSTCAKGRIIATSTITLSGGKTAQRVIETTVFKALAGPTEGAAVFSGGASENIDINFSKIKVYGNLFSNNNLNISWWSTVEVYATSSGEGKVLAINNYNQSWTSSVTSTAICAKNICNTTTTCGCTDTDKFEECETGSCPPWSISTPLVDFDSATSTSFKTRAQAFENAGNCQVFCKKAGQATTTCSTKCVFTATEFDDLLWEVREDGTLTLGTSAIPTITYVTGQVELKGGRHLVVNGALVADGTIDIGTKSKWTKGSEKDEGYSSITVNRPTATTTSGILTKVKINIGLYSSVTETIITGVIYANDEISLVSLSNSFTVRGGIIGRKLSFVSVWQWFNFILDNEIILYGLGYKIDGTTINPVYSPIVTVEHWEETY